MATTVLATATTVPFGYSTVWFLQPMEESVEVLCTQQGGCSSVRE